MKFSRYEQESILNYNAGEQTATLYTEIIRQLPQAEDGQHRAEGTGKADDDCKE